MHPAMTRLGLTSLRGLRCAVVLSGLIVAAGCGGDGSQSPTQPSPAPPVLSGTWTGTATDSGGPGRLTWQLEESAGAFSGTLSFTDAATGIAGTGQVSGTRSGSTLTFAMSIPAGAIGKPFASCSTSASGSGQVTSTTITGTYTGTNSCTGSFASGQLTLGRP
jgi:hypothetical protein